MRHLAKKIEGTPQTLRQAIILAICLRCGRDLDEQFRLIIKDFLAQKFQAQMFKTKSPETSKALEDLFKACTEDVA